MTSCSFPSLLCLLCLAFLLAFLLACLLACLQAGPNEAQTVSFCPLLKHSQAYFRAWRTSAWVPDVSGCISTRFQGGLACLLACSLACLHARVVVVGTERKRKTKQEEMQNEQNKKVTVNSVSEIPLSFFLCV